MAIDPSIVTPDIEKPKEILRYVCSSRLTDIIILMYEIHSKECNQPSGQIEESGPSSLHP